MCVTGLSKDIWMSTLGISSSYFYEVRKKFLKLRLSLRKRNYSKQVQLLNLSHETQRSSLQRTNEAIAWMTNYFDLVGEYLPHHMAIHLPSGLTKLHVIKRW